jgi:myo-inositol 2-dehydrogenase/D-chiro-inositol 1-dehydrogenase/scyllo-inositol 2-dehydrogenase (NAD+)
MVHHKNDHAPTVFDEFGDAYAAQLDGFARAIKSKTPATPGIEDARTALYLALSARASFETGGKINTISPLKPLTKSAN